jgi:redox-sensitive bicupin YhaK (pirin superfamily)
MIKIRPAKERGKTRTNWLDSSHTFSFNQYYDPRYSGFRDLLVINEDVVAPGQGFGTHSHDNMEILSYVMEGALEHRDSTGASGVLLPNELQRMSAGTGVRHSEFNASQTDKTHFLQIWITPERDGLKPEYEQRTFPTDDRLGRLRLIGSRNGREGSVTIHQDVSVYDALIMSGREVQHEIDEGRHAWVQVLKGGVTLNGSQLEAGDGAAVSNERLIVIKAVHDAEVLLFDLA